MSIEDNKNVVRSFIKAFEAANLEQVDHLTTEDFSFWIMPTTVRSGTYSKEQFLQAISDVLVELGGPMTLKINEMTAEDDRVSVAMEGNLPFKNGKVFRSHYHNLAWVRDGKIYAMREYLDTHHVGEIFGFPNVQV